MMKKKINFRYVRTTDNKVKNIESYYSDDYFTQSAYTYNSKLALTSIYMAISAYGTLNDSDCHSYEDYDKNISYFMNQMDFTNAKANDMFNRKPSIDSIGGFFASKKIKHHKEDYTLIAVAIRGGGYEAEWASNFTLGEEGYHQGFYKASDIIIADLNNYILDHHIQAKIKLWITGYSRAGAVANLVAGRLEKESALLNENILLSPENIYAYTFASPAAALLDDDIKNELYQNIFNITNPLDIVSRVVSKEIGFGRFGKEIVLPELLIDNKNLYHNLSNEYKKISKKEYDLTGYCQYKINDKKQKIKQSILLDKIEKIFSKFDRKDYVEIVQDYAREVFSKHNKTDAFNLLSKHINDYIANGNIEFTKEEELYLSILNDNLQAIALAHDSALCIAWMRLEFN